jgi:hypothetical protein
MTVSRTKWPVEPYGLGAVRLYREDLRAIAVAVAEVGDLEIAGDGFKATSPDDFETVDEKVPSMTIAARRAGSAGMIKVILSPKAALVELTDPDTLMSGVLVRIRQVCERRRRRLPSFLYRGGSSRLGVVDTLTLVMIGVALVGVVSVAFASQNAHGSAGWNPAAGVVAGLVVSGIISCYVWSKITQKVVIVNALRAERPTYWQRTRDHWWIAIVTTVLGTVVGYLLGKFT